MRVRACCEENGGRSRRLGYILSTGFAWRVDAGVDGCGWIIIIIFRRERSSRARIRRWSRDN